MAASDHVPEREPSPIGLLHTAAAHERPFAELFAELAPEVPLRHLVRDDLLAAAAAAGGPTDEVLDQAAAALEGLIDDGARVAVCTCSTIGGGATRARQRSGHAILRIDQALADAAVEAGGRIALLATAATTLAPTRALLEETARARGRHAEIVEFLIDGAWAHFEEGDLAGYFDKIEEGLRATAPTADVVILAQASMAPVQLRCGDIGVPVLSSPRLGVAAAVRLYREKAEI